MRRFHIGDRVRCISDARPMLLLEQWVSRGGVYTVSFEYEKGGVYAVGLLEVPYARNWLEDYVFCEDRFVLVQSAAEIGEEMTPERIRAGWLQQWTRHAWSNIRRWWYTKRLKQTELQPLNL